MENRKQTLLFSATFPQEILDKIQSFIPSNEIVYKAIKQYFNTHNPPKDIQNTVSILIY